ncbi:MAG: precorrin-4 C(11)-methyltransferase [Candidatus Adiutrix sp.]|jgi:precorrin-4/cobalt-precorrin-4 C11-methyltransferase|nr:precorrin-4 C(11)-methyltransferase [Candidatus Adiutrix sp.]
MNRNPVLFVGAGPGDPELITVAGKKALEKADLVLYAGSLVNPEILSWCRPGARLVDSAPLNLREITDLMLESWRNGDRVLRLHTGDPSLYGAIYEQLVILKERGLPCRIIPGVTSALAAAAVLGLEYTLPEITQTLILTRAAGRTPVPAGEDLASLTRSRSSMAIYLSAGQGAEVGRILGEAYGPEAPLALLYRVTWPDGRLLWCTCSTLARTLEEEKLDRHTIILAGPAVTALRLGREVPKSKLYDPGYSHAGRQAGTKAGPGGRPGSEAPAED